MSESVHMVLVYFVSDVIVWRCVSLHRTSPSRQSEFPPSADLARLRESALLQGKQKVLALLSVEVSPKYSRVNGDLSGHIVSNSPARCHHNQNLLLSLRFQNDFLVDYSYNYYSYNIY